MSYELTSDEKITIINNHLRSVAYKKFSAEIELIAESAVSSPNTIKVAELNAEIAKCESQIAALTTEIESLS